MGQDAHGFDALYHQICVDVDVELGLAAVSTGKNSP